MILAGTDELGYLLSKDAELDAWEAAHPPRIDTRSAPADPPAGRGTAPRQGATGGDAARRHPAPDADSVHRRTSSRVAGTLRPPVRRSAGERARRHHAVPHRRCGHPRLALRAPSRRSSASIGAIAGGAAAILALPYLADPLSGVDPTIRPFIVLAGLVVAVGIGESLGAALGRALADRLGDGLLEHRRPDGGLGARGRAGAARRVAGRQPAGRRADPAAGRDRRQLDRRADDGRRPAARDRGRRRSRRPARRDRAARRLRRLRAAARRPRSIARRTAPRGPSRRPPRRARSRSRPPPAGWSRSVPGSSSPGATSSRMPTSSPAPGAAACGSPSGGQIRDAVPVLFDPGLDVALLYVDGLQAVPLTFATHRSRAWRDRRDARLSRAAVPLTILPAAVSGRYPATGRDIYGREEVRRQILELRAEINRGDSGGPLVLKDGTVGGRRLRRGPDQPGGRLCAGRDRGRGGCPARNRPTVGRRRGRLPALTPRP